MKNSMIAKMRNTKLGRALARLVGEDAGAVMMEYVILAVLIAAACVIAIAVFGRAVVGEAYVATTAMGGKGSTASDIQQKNQTMNDDNMKQTASENVSSFSDAEKAGAKMQY